MFKLKCNITKAQAFDKLNDKSRILKIMLSEKSVKNNIIKDFWNKSKCIKEIGDIIQFTDIVKTEMGRIFRLDINTSTAQKSLKDIFKSQIMH